MCIIIIDDMRSKHANHRVSIAYKFFTMATILASTAPLMIPVQSIAVKGVRIGENNIGGFGVSYCCRTATSMKAHNGLPLQCVIDDNIMTLYAPNRFVLDWVRDKYVNRINELLTLNESSNPLLLRFDVGSKPVASSITASSDSKSVSQNNNTNESLFAPKVSIVIPWLGEKFGAAVFSIIENSISL